MELDFRGGAGTRERRIIDANCTSDHRMLILCNYWAILTNTNRQWHCKDNCSLGIKCLCMCECVCVLLGGANTHKANQALTWWADEFVIPMTFRWNSKLLLSWIADSFCTFWTFCMEQIRLLITVTIFVLPNRQHLLHVHFDQQMFLAEENSK